MSDVVVYPDAIPICLEWKMYGKNESDAAFDEVGLSAFEVWHSQKAITETKWF